MDYLDSSRHPSSSAACNLSIHAVQLFIFEEVMKVPDKTSNSASAASQSYTSHTEIIIDRNITLDNINTL